jgi:eukaryotic-like serine/threonine-protein kinase
LDFGLAKAFTGEQAELNLTNSPTLSLAATQQGIIPGTAAYMSPEQARGKAVDKRTDIWAFGCVLYEMLTGQAAFQGEDVSKIFASDIKAEANFNLPPASINPRLRELLSRCPQKDPKRRYQDIGDVRIELEQVTVQPAITEPVASGRERISKLRPTIPWVLVGVVLAAIVTGVTVWNLKPTEPRQVIRLYHDLPKNQQLSGLSNFALAVSPDGKQIAYATDAGIYVCSLDELDARLLV